MRQFKTMGMGSRSIAGVAFYTDNLRRFKIIRGNLGEFETLGSRPIAGVAFSLGNLRRLKTIEGNFRQWGVGPPCALAFLGNLRQLKEILDH